MKYYLVSKGTVGCMPDSVDLVAGEQELRVVLREEREWLKDSCGSREESWVKSILEPVNFIARDLPVGHTSIYIQTPWLWQVEVVRVTEEEYDAAYCELSSD